MRLSKFPHAARPFFPGAVFSSGNRGQVILTFDDGPDPSSTPVLIDILNRHGIKAIFFCNGKRAIEFPGLMKEISGSGHLTGNHGFYHIDGWKLSTTQFCENVREAESYTSGRYFRPPYGHIYPWQLAALKRQYLIFFWDIIGYDFDKRISPQKCLRLLNRGIASDSVIALHDSRDSHSPAILEELIGIISGKNYGFCVPVQ